MKKTEEEQNEYSELTEQDWIMLNHLPKPDMKFPPLIEVGVSYAVI